MVIKNDPEPERRDEPERTHYRGRGKFLRGLASTTDEPEAPWAAVYVQCEKVDRRGHDLRQRRDKQLGGGCLGLGGAGQ